MTTSTITRAEWEAFADATLDHDPRAVTLGRELTTPPVALAKRARHRKPNRRRNVIAKAATTALVLVAAIVASITAARHVPTAPAYYGLTPAQLSQVATVLEAPGYVLTADVTPTPDRAACNAVYRYHHVNAHDYAGVHAAEAERAWDHAAHLALYAGPGLDHAIRTYLLDGYGWSLVAYDCNPDA